jgi:hypothetical protein
MSTRRNRRAALRTPTQEKSESTKLVATSVPYAVKGTARILTETMDHGEAKSFRGVVV